MPIQDPVAVVIGQCLDDCLAGLFGPITAEPDCMARANGASEIVWHSHRQEHGDVQHRVARA
jgi:hypothetical protein